MEDQLTIPNHSSNEYAADDRPATSISPRKRALQECTTESIRPHKMRRCNTAPPNALRIKLDYKDANDVDDLKHDGDEQRQSSLSSSTSSSLKSPTVTVLSGCDDAYHRHEIHKSAPAHFRCDNHHSNVLDINEANTLLSQHTNKTNNEAQCIDINTFGLAEQDYSAETGVSDSRSNVSYQHQDVVAAEAEKCGPSMTMKSEHDDDDDYDIERSARATPPADTRTSSADTIDVDLNDDPVKQVGKHEPDDDFKEKTQHHQVTRLVRLLLDAKRVGGLIGKQGSSITRIREESQAKILITRAVPHSLFRVCSLEGDYDSIVRGMCLVVDQIAKETTRSPPFHATILVDEKNIGCLIGKGGGSITEIRADTLASIYISSHLLRNSTEKTVDIYGERTQVHEAMKRVIARLCSNACFAPTRQYYNPELDGCGELAHTPPRQNWQPAHCVTMPNNNQNSTVSALLNASAYANLSQLYPYNCNLGNSSALNTRLLNVNFPQIISAAAPPPHCNSVNAASLICSSPHRQNAFSQPILSQCNSAPFAAAAFSAPQEPISLPTNTTTSSVLSPLSVQNNNPHSSMPTTTTTITSNPNPYLLSPHLSNLSSQRLETTNTFVNSNSNNSGALPTANLNVTNYATGNLTYSHSYSESNRNSNNQSNNNSNSNSHPGVYNTRCHALDYRLPTENTHNHNQNYNHNQNSTVCLNKQMILPSALSSPLSSNLYYNARVIGTGSPVSASRSQSASVMAHTPPVNNAMISSSSGSVDSLVLTVAAHLIGGVIGKGGRNIQDIRRHSNAEIKIDNERQNPSPNRYITIKGTQQQIAIAVSFIQNSVSPHMPTATSSNWQMRA